MGTVLRYFGLVRSAVWPGRQGIARPTPRHYLVTFLLLLALPLYLAYHVLGLLLDEVLFRGWRRVTVDAPVFVLGPPRSGTTSVHEVLNDDRRFTTFSTWECLFGLSVSWRRWWLAVGRADRRMGRPLGRSLDWLTARLTRSLDEVHPVRLDAPEEDYFVFLPILWCFILIVPFPDAAWLWRWGRFDEQLSSRQRLRLMGWYRSAIQRHLYVHRGRRYLAKNASFAPLAQTLAETFPDARIVCCLREPRAALSSQLSSLDPGLRFCHGRYERQAFADRMARQFAFYYRNLFTALTAPDAPRSVFLPLPALARLEESIEVVYRRLDLPMDQAFRRRLASRDAQMRAWHSDHRHDPGRLDETARVLAKAIGPVPSWCDFTASHPLPAPRGAAPSDREATTDRTQNRSQSGPQASVPDPPMEAASS